MLKNFYKLLRNINWFKRNDPFLYFFKSSSEYIGGTQVPFDPMITTPLSIFQQ